MGNTPRIGFIGWNPFQFLHIKKLAASISGACFVIEKRKEYISEFSDAILNDPDTPIMVWDRSKMPSLDGVFDILVCQTPFFRLETFEKTKIAMIQYGYAKEPHNYGAWRAFADLCLTYGPYATQKIMPFCPAVSVGNPRYDEWHDSSFHESAKNKYSHEINPNLKTVLYLPTWGDLSSVDQYLEAIYELASKYNVLLKMHHNTELLEAGRKDRIISGEIRHYGANDDLLELLSITDIVISDYSGAIFDAIYCVKPVVLLNADLKLQLGGKKIDDYSIEYARRDELGYEVNRPEDLRIAIDRLAEDSSQVVDGYHTIRRELFSDTHESVELAKQELTALWLGRYQQNQSQSYIRNEMRELYKTQRLLAIASKKLQGDK